MICSWNVRGFNDLSKEREVRKVLTHNKVSIGALFETIVSVGK